MVQRLKWVYNMAVTISSEPDASDIKIVPGCKKGEDKGAGGTGKKGAAGRDKKAKEPRAVSMEVAGEGRDPRRGR